MPDSRRLCAAASSCIQELLCLYAAHLSIRFLCEASSTRYHVDVPGSYRASTCLKLSLVVHRQYAATSQEQRCLHVNLVLTHDHDLTWRIW